MLAAAHFWQPFQEFVFMRRALLGGLVLACSTAPLGVFLILRRMSLIGDAVAHGILPGAALGFWFAGLSLPALTIGGLGAGMSMAGIAAWITRATGLREDASLAAIYPISLASRRADPGHRGQTPRPVAPVVRLGIGRRRTHANGHVVGVGVQPARHGTDLQTLIAGHPGPAFFANGQPSRTLGPWRISDLGCA